MGEFFRTLDRFCARFDVKWKDALWLKLHYPVFKGLWLSECGKGRRQSIAARIAPLFRSYAINCRILLKSGVRASLPISFQAHDLSSFKEIFWGGEYDAPFNLGTCETCVDLGSNTGMAGLFFLTQADLRKIVFVEANPVLAERLKALLAGFSQPAETAVENVLISGDSHEQVVFHVSENHRMSSVLPPQDPGNHFEKITVASLPLRELLSKHQLEQVDLLKMDIEGAEFDILQKDPSVFRKFRYLCVEVHGEQPVRDVFASGIVAQGFQLRGRRSSVACCEMLYAERH